jgi:transcription initiation factor IIE alpha subunit
MITVKFHCDSCETKGKISFDTQDDTLNEGDIAYCPICAHDITENNNDEEVEDNEQIG